MNRYRFWILLWINALCLACQGQTWQKVSPKDSGFSVQMPGKPLMEKDVEETFYGKTITYTWTLEETICNFTAGYAELGPAEAIAPSKAQLDAFRGGLLENSVKILGEREIKLKEHSGRATSFKSKEGVILRSRYFALNRRIYFVLATAFEEDLAMATPAMDKFFDSLSFFDLPLAPAPEWKKFSASKGRFSALFPGAPRQDKVVKSPRQPPVFTFIGYDQTAAYIVTYIDFVQGQMPDDTEEALTVFQSGFFAGIKRATLKSIKNITLDGWPGRELQFTDANGVEHQARLYAVRRRCFIIDAAVWPGNREIAAERIKKFLESFVIEGEAPQQEKVITPKDA